LQDYPKKWGKYRILQTDMLQSSLNNLQEPYCKGGARDVGAAKNMYNHESKKHSFADISTGKHYPGVHSVTLFVNGMERGALDFGLKG